MKAHELARRLLEMPDVPVQAEVSEVAYELEDIELVDTLTSGLVVMLDGDRSW